MEIAYTCDMQYMVIIYKASIWWNTQQFSSCMYFSIIKDLTIICLKYIWYV